MTHYPPNTPNLPNPLAAMLHQQNDTLASPGRATKDTGFRADHMGTQFGKIRGPQEKPTENLALHVDEDCSAEMHYPGQRQMAGMPTGSCINGRIRKTYQLPHYVHRCVRIVWRKM